MTITPCMMHPNSNLMKASILPLLISLNTFPHPSLLMEEFHRVLLENKMLLAKLQSDSSPALIDEWSEC